MLNIKRLKIKVDKNNINSVIRNEIEILNMMQHENIVKLYEALEDENTQKIYLVLEYCARGALFSEVFWKGFDRESSKEPSFHRDNTKREIPLKIAKKYMFQAAEAIHYCRSE